MAKNEAIIKQSAEFKVDCALKFIWKIEHVSKEFVVLESDEFNLEPICISKWKLVLNYCQKDDALYIGLRRIDVSAHSVLVVADFTVRNSKGIFFAKRLLRASYAWGDITKFCPKTFPKPNSAKGVRNDLRKIFRLNKDDTLIIDGSIGTNTCCSYTEPKGKAVEELHIALITSYKDKIFTDVEFVIDDDHVPAHKFILAARSPVFRKMFDSGMQESTNNQIVLTDIDRPTLEYFLGFLYSGALPSFDTDVALKLYTVADKYDVQSLKFTCRHILLLTLATVNVCDIISIANIHDDKELYKEAIAHIAKEFKKVVHSDGWKRLMSENIELSVKIISSVLPNPDDDSSEPSS